MTLLAFIDKLTELLPEHRDTQIAVAGDDDKWQEATVFVCPRPEYRPTLIAIVGKEDMLKMILHVANGGKKEEFKKK